MCAFPFLCICSLFYLCLIILFLSSRINRGGGKKRPREEEFESDGLKFESMALDGFEAIREEEDRVIVPVVPLKIGRASCRERV